MSKRVYGLKLMSLAWYTYEIGWNEIGMHDNFMLGWWDMILLWSRRNSTMVAWWCLIG